MENKPIVSPKTPDDVAKIGAGRPVDGSQGQTVKKVGRPRKQAENGLTDGSQIPPETAPGSGSAPVDSDESPKRSQARRRGTQQGKSELIPAKLSAVEIGKKILEETPNLEFLFSGSQWFQYDENSGWVEGRKTDVETFVVRFINKHFPENYSKSKTADVVEWLRAMWSIKRVQGIYSYFVTRSGESDELKGIPAPDWIPCLNLLINTRTGKTREFTRNLFTLGRVPCDYDPAAVCPRWNQFLEETLDSESAAVLQEFFGVSLTFDRSFQGFAILYGEGGNGKGVVCDILRDLNTGAECAVSLAGLGDRFSRYPLTEKRVNIDSEGNNRINRNQIPEMERILKLGAVGESALVEKKGVDGETRPLVALMIFAVNPPFPAFLDTSRGIYRRLRVIHFQRTFAGTPGENNHLKDDLKRELPGILNWALEGYRRLIESGAKQFSNTEAGKRVVSDSRKMNHPEETFFDEFLTVTENGLVSTRKVYERYRKWMEETGNNFPMAENKFSARLLAYFQKAGAQVQKERRGNLRYYTGLELEGDLEGF
ncbi:MAG: hypothetical protein IJU53_02035 [Thermoguttaceae bacterium]|nr:hypothetical protein [Thermoguttaceae bacterium]